MQEKKKSLRVRVHYFKIDTLFLGLDSTLFMLWVLDSMADAETAWLLESSDIYFFNACCYFQVSE